VDVYVPRTRRWAGWRSAHGWRSGQDEDGAARRPSGQQSRTGRCETTGQPTINELRITSCRFSFCLLSTTYTIYLELGLLTVWARCIPDPATDACHQNGHLESPSPLRPTVHRLPSTVYRLPSTVYRLPPTVYRLRQTLRLTLPSDPSHTLPFSSREVSTIPACRTGSLLAIATSST